MLNVNQPVLIVFGKKRGIAVTIPPVLMLFIPDGYYNKS